MALIIALMSMALMTALGSALVLTTVAESAIVSNYRDAAEALYAAEAAAGWVMSDLHGASDWTAAASASYLDAAILDILDIDVRSRIRVKASVIVLIDEAETPALEQATIVAEARAGPAHRTVEVVVSRPWRADDLALLTLMSWQERP